MRRTKVEAPLSTKELKEKIRNSKIEIPKYADNLPLDDVEGDFENPQFSAVLISGVSAFTDSVWVNGDGIDHKIDGGISVEFNWAAPGLGFGEMRLKLLNNGKLIIDTEKLGKEFAKKVLCAIIDSAKDIDEVVQ